MADCVWAPRLAIAGAALIVGFALASPASAEETIKKQCSEKYQAAKKANTLNGQKWNEFYKQCDAELKGAPPSAPRLRPAPAPAPGSGTSAGLPKSRRKKKRSKRNPAPRPCRRVRSSIRTRSIRNTASLSAQLRAASRPATINIRPIKPTNSNGGLKWIEKGGGYYSLCNKHLKGE